MRRTAACAAFVAALAAAAAQPAAQTDVRVSISHGRLIAAPPEAPIEKPLGERTWESDFVVRAKTTGAAPCEPLRISARLRQLWNRRASGPGEYYPGDIVDENGRIAIPASARSGETIEVTAWAVCLEGNALRPVSDRVQSIVRAPRHPCEQGPWQVLSTRGANKVQDDYFGTRFRWLRLRRGDALYASAAIRTERNGRLTFGAPRCNGLRITLFGSSTADVGRYSLTQDGDTTSIWGHARVSLDRHGRGVSTDVTSLQPLGDRAASFEVWTAPRLTTIRLTTGLLLVRTGDGRSKLAFLRAGVRAAVRCNAAGDCSLERSRLKAEHRRSRS